MSGGVEYDPARHHRRSIRLKGHDYAGGGLYFVTICAHREFIRWAAGARPASPSSVTATPAGSTAPARGPFVGLMRAVIEERIGVTEEKFPDARWVEWVVMPDHFHALIRMEGGGLRLGDIVGGFKSAVSREWRRARRGEACLAPFAGRIWQRNYYEIIVRSPDAERRIAEYIRMNPWRCVQEFGDGLRGIGNPALWNGEKLGVLCSRNAPRIGQMPDSDVYFGGWHSPKEKEMLDWLLKNKRRVIACPAWGIETMRIPEAWLPALEDNRMLILEMGNVDGNLAAAAERNRFVLEHADARYIPHVTPDGMLDRLLQSGKRGVL